MRNISTFIILGLVFATIKSYSQYTNIRVDGAGSWRPEEVTIAINPIDPNIIAAGANIDHFYISTDAGNTWGENNLTSTLGVWGDPCVIFDSLGNLYYAHLSNPVTGWWIDRIVVQKSTDNGQTWNDGVGIGQNIQPQVQDKEWLAVDLTQSAYRGNIYVTWTEFDQYGSSNPSDSSRIRFSKSTDEGETWSNAITISDVSGDCIDSDNTTEGAVPCIGPDGDIYVSWAGPVGLVFDKSTDGGVTWGTDIFVSDIPGGWDYDIPGIMRCNGLPITMCDISESPYNGDIYICWSDQRNGSTDTDVFLSKSTDSGATWSPAARVNDDVTTRHQFFVWSDVDQSTGHLWFVFYDRRNTTGTATDVYVVKSTDGGNTFENFKVSESSFTPTSSIFFGDYTNISAWEGEIYPFWMRLHNGELSVWTTIITDSTVIPVELTNFTADAKNGKVILNWETSSETNNQGFEVQRTYLNSSLIKGKDKKDWITIGFVTGHGTTTEKHNYTFLDNSVMTGIYQYRLKQMDFDGTFEFSNEIEVNVIALDDFVLFQNYPNPFNPLTTLSYQLPEAGYVTLKVYDMLGNELETLVNAVKPAGVHEVNFNSGNLSSGLYLYKMNSGNFEKTRKMLLVK
jgi:hypothetical protein